MKLATASVFYRLLQRLTNIQIPPQRRRFPPDEPARRSTQLKQLREKDRFVRGLVSWVGFNQTGVTYHRDKRYAGETKYPYRKMIKFAFDGITSFSTVAAEAGDVDGLRRRARWRSCTCSACSCRSCSGYTVEGWATIMVAMLFLGSVQLICLGILGEYLGRIFNEVKPRPMYVIEEALSFNREVSAADPIAVLERRARAL